MTIKFDKIKKDDKNTVVTKFGDLCLGETFILANAYRSDGLDLDSNILYIMVGDGALELNNENRKRVFEDELEVVAVDLEVSSVKLKGEK